VIFAATKGYFDKIPTNKIKIAEKDTIDFIKNRYTALMDTLQKENAISSESEVKLAQALEDFVASKKY
jgi:F0F1-type ATP synthase alpha subunit